MPLDVPAARSMTRPSAASVRASLQKVYGAQPAEHFWRDACRRAGVATDADDLPSLLRIADALAALGGPLSATGVGLIIRVRAYQALQTRGEVA